MNTRTVYTVELSDDEFTVLHGEVYETKEEAQKGADMLEDGAQQAWKRAFGEKKPDIKTRVYEYTEGREVED